MLPDHQKKARILIADDEPEIRHLLHELLSDDYDCSEVASGEAALETLRAERFDLVLSDIMMGGISGLEVLPQVLRDAPETIFIMISGVQTIESAIEALRIGAFDYVMKPFDLRQIEATVRRAVEHRELRAAKYYYEAQLEELVKARTAELHKTSHTLQTIIQASPLALFLLDTEGVVRMWNPAAANIFGWSDFEVLGKCLPVMLEGEEGNARLAGEATTPQNKTVTSFEARRRKSDGSVAHLSVWTAPLLDARDTLTGTVCLVADITERKQAEERIHYLAYHDTLTDLPNRILFKDRLVHALELRQTDRRPLAIISLSLDRFKKVNDTLGDLMGDELLRGVAKRLKSCIREEDTVSNWGNDEFALLLTQTTAAEDVGQMIQSIYDTLKPPFYLAGHEIYLTISAGISLYPEDGADALMLLKNAGAALYRAKQLGGNCQQFYTPDMNERALVRLSLESSLRRALERDEFVLHYQPQVALDTGRIVGMEALLRWQHAEKGLIPPAEFIPLAEDTGLIVPIGEWVLHTACAQTRLWHAQGFDSLLVSVNLSPRQFQQPHLLRMVESQLKQTQLEPTYLELELTESTIMKNTGVTIDTLRELRALGIKISVDDFGSGYSSLSYLKHLPIDVLKIDQSFVRDMTTDTIDGAIVRAIITLAHSLRLKVKAEGVETIEQLELLRLLACDEMQGYLFSRPLRVQEFAELLMEGRTLNSMKTVPLSHA